MNEGSKQQQKFIRDYYKNKRIVTIGRTAIFICFFILWEVSARLGFIDSFIFASPSIILKCIYNLGKDGTLFFHIGITLTETIVSFLLVIFAGLFITILLWMNKRASDIVEPYLVILNSLPKSALAPLLIVWLGANMKTIIVAGMSVAIFGTVLNLFTSFSEVDKDAIKLIRTLGGTKKDILLLVVLPSNLPAMIALMKVNIGLSLVGVIIGEFLAAKRGLGYLIIYGSQVFKLDWVLTSIIILCFISILLYKGINLLEKKVSRQ